MLLLTRMDIGKIFFSNFLYPLFFFTNQPSPIFWKVSSDMLISSVHSIYFWLEPLSFFFFFNSILRIHVLGLPTHYTSILHFVNFYQGEYITFTNIYIYIWKKILAKKIFQHSGLSLHCCKYYASFNTAQILCYFCSYMSFSFTYFH